MKRLFVLIFSFVFLCSCALPYEDITEKTLPARLFYIKKIRLGSNTPEQNEETDEFMHAFWVSQFDMHPIYRDGGNQRSESDYINLINTMLENILRDGFDTVFLQVRPNGDSMYESEFYPNSKYVAGTYGGDIEYDVISLFLSIAMEKGVAVHAWINPFRLCREDELTAHSEGILYEWYCEGIGKRIEKGEDGLLYLDPSYEEATELIINGAREILEKYDFCGIHIDDYFYPTEFEFDDDENFIASQYYNIGDFRRSNINRTVRALYALTREYGKIFGVSPAGNIYSLEEGWYVDIFTWLSDDGYIDYVMPQLYYGFKNAVCPFDKILADWVNAVKNENIKLYIGLSGAKCVLGSENAEDSFAGDSGKYEWRDEKDILARSYELAESVADGICIFSYSSFFDVINGSENELAYAEKENLTEAIKKNIPDESSIGDD